MPTLIHSVPMTVTFVSEAKKFGFAARHDTGESVYISPMLAEQIGLDRTSGGRVLCATIAPNTEEHGAQGNLTAHWRVMSWSAHQIRPGETPTLTASLRDDLTDILTQIDQLQTGIDMLRARVRTTLNQLAA